MFTFEDDGLTGPWYPFRVESRFASDTKGSFHGSLEGGGFLSSPSGVSGHFSGRKTPDVAKTHDILFLRNEDGSDTCRVVIPNIENVILDMNAKVTSAMMGYCPEMDGLEMFCRSRFLLEDEMRVKKTIEDEIGRAIRSARGTQGSRAIDIIRYAVESSEEPALEIWFLGKQSGEVSVVEHMTVGMKRYVFKPRAFLTRLEKLLSECYPPSLKR